MLSSVTASISLVLTKVYTLLPVRHNTELTELKKGKRLHRWPIICRPNYFDLPQFGFFLAGAHWHRAVIY